MKKVNLKKTALAISLVASTSFQMFAANFSGGTGTVNDPYLVATPQQFDEIRNHRDKHFKLTADLDFKDYVKEGRDTWWPLGEWGSGDNAPDRFSGVFDGNGHTISNLVADKKSYDYSIFGVVEGAVIKNLLVENCEIKGEGRLGVLTGATFRSTIDQVGIINSKCLNIYSGPHAGGITGPMFQSEISNSYVSGGEVAANDGAGGISAILEQGSSITNCYASCSVEGNVNVGGLAGYASTASVTNCIALNSKITCHDVNDGRIVGIVHGEKKLSNNYAGADVMINATQTTTGLGANEKSGETALSADLATVAFYADKAKFAILESDPSVEDYKQIWALDTEIASYPVFEWQINNDPTAIVNDETSRIDIVIEENSISIRGLENNDLIRIYNIGGALQNSITATTSEVEIPLSFQGMRIINILSKNSNHTFKVLGE